MGLGKDKVEKDVCYKLFGEVSGFIAKYGGKALDSDFEFCNSKLKEVDSAMSALDKSQDKEKQLLVAAKAKLVKLLNKLQAHRDVATGLTTEAKRKSEQKAEKVEKNRAYLESRHKQGKE